DCPALLTVTLYVDVVWTLENSVIVFSWAPPETATVLDTEAAALAARFTVTVMGGWLAPAASTSLRVHVNVASVQFQPVPAIPVAVKTAGSVSATVTAPVVGPCPRLLTVTV